MSAGRSRNADAAIALAGRFGRQRCNATENQTALRRSKFDGLAGGIVGDAKFRDSQYAPWESLG